jgi:uncharacterized SAM-binding protein YcdF (DUF218 family)
MADFFSIDFLVPPTVLILLAAVSAWATLWRPHVGVAFAIISTSLLYLAALPIMAAWMIEEVEIKTPTKPDFSTAQAIVVLGGGVHPGDGDKVPDTLGPWSLERIVLAAQAYRQLKLKVAVSGGRVASAHTSEASLMKAALETQFSVPVTWVDDQSRTTYENAVLTAKLLKADNVTTIVLITQAWHMRRALWSFERAGLHAIPYPAPLTYDENDRLADYLPSIGALERSYHALHEAIGLAYYRLRY